MKKRTNKKLTMEALTGHFLERGTDGALKINENHLNYTIISTLDKEPLYKAMTETKRKAKAVAWEAFSKMTADIMNTEYSMKKDTSSYYATSAQLKAFLDQYGRGYDSIAKSVQHVKETRAKIAKEQKKEENEQTY